MARLDAAQLTPQIESVLWDFAWGQRHRHLRTEWALKDENRRMREAIGDLLYWIEIQESLDDPIKLEHKKTLDDILKTLKEVSSDSDVDR